MRALSELEAGVVGTGFVGDVHVRALRALGVGVVHQTTPPERPGRCHRPLEPRATLVEVTT
jgi:hypothetical protein